MKDALISIVTPAYNAGRYLADTIRSVQRQTYPRWEMLIVDDCSTDETYAVACSFAEADSRIRVLRHEKNGGVAAARNTAPTTSARAFPAGRRSTAGTSCPLR